MKEKRINIKQYQTPRPDGGKMMKLILLVFLLLMVGWLVQKGLKKQVTDTKSHSVNENTSPREISNITIDTLNK